jgi:primary-amine oxidase
MTFTPQRAIRVAVGLQRSIVAAAVFAALACWQVAEAAPTHPLDPLDGEELTGIRDILAQSDLFSKNTNFAWIQLVEPPKKIVEGFQPGADFPRRAYVAAIDYDKGKTYRVVVDLRSGKIASLDDLGAQQPGLTSEDSAIAQAIVDGDPRIKEALTRRGFKIPDRVSTAVRVQYLSVGIDRTLDQENHRLMRILFAPDQGAAVSSFIEGLMVVVDLYARKVIRFHDVPGAPNVQAPHDVLDPDLSPIVATSPVVSPQPDRHNFVVEGHVVTWRNWRLRFGFNLREGLVLYQIGFNDAGRLRPILYRASVSEVLTAYGDPDQFWSWMQIFDEGCFGLGYESTPGRPGRELPANAMTLAAVVPDPTQQKFSDLLADRIYLYERDGGNLIYHQQGDRTVYARATELVIGSLVSLGSYTYAFNWVFRQDGSFAFETELSGVIQTKLVRGNDCGTCAAIVQGPGSNGESRIYQPGGDDQFGGLIYPTLVGISHQHWFNLRLDFDIDGTGNAVMESNVKRAPRTMPNDATANGAPIEVTRTVFGQAVEAKRDMNHDTSRSWTIYNPSALDGRWRPAGYTLMPTGNTAAIFPRSREREAVGFALHHLWVTPQREEQLYAAGAYPNQAKSNYADTLYSYADTSSVYDKDIVVWYSLGDTHVPRPEDFPLMSSKKLAVGFHPDGFFQYNPALGPPGADTKPSPASPR